MKTATSIKLILLGVLLVAVGLGVRALQRYTSPEYLTERARRELEAAVQAKVGLGSVCLTADGTVAVSGLHLTLDGEDAPVVEVPVALVEADLAQALRRRIMPRRATLVKPVVRLSFSRDHRRWNVQNLFPARPERPRAAAVRPEGPPKVGAHSDGIVLEDATLIVRHEGLFGDEEPREVTGIHARILPAGPSGGRWTFEGRVVGGVFGGAQLEGWVKTGGSPEFGMNIDARGLETSEEFWRTTPYWHRAPEGLDVAGRLSCSGLIRAEGRRGIQVDLDVGVKEGDIRTPYYPLSVTDAAGRVSVTEERVFIRDVAGRVPEEELSDELTGGHAPQVHVNGSVSLRRGVSHLGVLATDLPICRRTIEGIPSAGPDVWRRLGPAGIGRLGLTLTARPGRRTQFVADVSVREASMHPREVPAPLEDVAGRIVVSNDGVRLEGLTGMFRQSSPGEGGTASSATFRADGFVGLDERIEAMHVRVSNLRTDEATVCAIPRVGEELWRLFRPRVCADAEVLIRDGAVERSYTALIGIHGGRAEPDFLGMPLTDAGGRLRVDNGQVFIEEFSGVLHTEGSESEDLRARSVFRMRGTLDPAAHAADIDLAASDLMLNERVLQAIPGVGPRLWKEAHPVGVAALTGKVTYGGDGSSPRFFLDMDLRDVALLARSLPVPVDAMSGQLLITEKRLVSNRVSGVSCGGSFDAALSVYYGPDAVRPRFAGTASFSEVDLGRFAEKVTRRQHELEGRVSGTLDLGGELGDQSTVTGKGHINLQEGYLWSRPLFASLLSVLHLTLPKGVDVPAEGSATFDVAADLVSVKSFDLTGGGLSLSGRGTVRLDGTLDLTMVAVGAPENSGGIPIVTPFVNWVMRLVERELVRLDVTGTIEQPNVQSTVLSKIAWPLTNLRAILIDPLLGADEETP